MGSATSRLSRATTQLAGHGRETECIRVCALTSTSHCIHADLEGQLITWPQPRQSVHGEYRFSVLPMAPPVDAEKTGGHITGMGMCEYMETFYEKFLKGKVVFKFKTEIRTVARNAAGVWNISVEDLCSREAQTLKFSRIVLCTGVGPPRNIFSWHHFHVYLRVAVTRRSLKSYPWMPQDWLVIRELLCIHPSSGSA